MPDSFITELKQFSFFSGFEDSLLRAVCTMMTEVSFVAGRNVLSTGGANDSLYFLRSGSVDVLVDGEKVTSLSERGEVFGEMSAFTGNQISATVRASTDIQCFVISSKSLDQIQQEDKSKFQSLLYRVYASVLNDRILKTNQKAKMYESTARELERAKRELELVTGAQMNFMRANQAKSKNVLLLEPDKKQSVTIKSAFGGSGVSLQIAATIGEAQELYQQTKPDLVFCEEGSALEFFRWCQEQKFTGSLILLQKLVFNFDLLKQLPFVQNVIARDVEDRAGTVKNLLTALAKISSKDIFGVYKYLAWGSEIQERTLQQSTDREPLREEALTYFKQLGMRSSLLDRVQIAAEEMMMNAIYDAPVDARGKSLYNHLPRSTHVTLKSNEHGKFRFGCDGNILAISVEDPFGALTRDVVIQYLHSCYGNEAGSLNSAKGGAGRGLHQIMESCDFTIFNVKPGHKTEVIGLFDIDAALQKKENRPQFQFYFDL